MAAIKLDQFAGMLPAWDAHLLPTGQATYAKNTYLFSGALVGWRIPKRLHTLNASTRMAYRIPTVSQLQAHAYLVFKTQPNVGDTVVVGEQTYRFTNSLANPFDVLIGTGIADTAVHFQKALTADGGKNTNAGVYYGDDTPRNGDVRYYGPDADVIPGLSAPQVIQELGYNMTLVGAEDFGAAYNLIKVSESTGNARLSWLYDTDVLSHTTTTFLGGTNPTLDASITGTSTWLEFTDPDTNVFKSPVAHDQWNRFYFASPSAPPRYNTYDRIVAGSDPWLLGVPAPGCAPTLSVTGGGNNLQLGNITAGTTYVNGVPNSVYVMKVRTTGATQLTQMSFDVSADHVTATTGIPAARFAAVLYDDNNGVPGTLLNHGQINTGIYAESDNVSAFVNPTGLDSDTDYWIGFIIDTLTPFIDGPAGGGSAPTKTWSNTFTNGPSPVAPAAAAATGINMWGDFLTSDILESRSYVYTWVTEYGEEGPPSPPTILDGWSNGTWTVGPRRPPADDTGVLRNIKKLRIYRTVPGTGGTAVFFYVTELDFDVSEFIDQVDDAEVALNDQLETTSWFEPPTALEGFQVMQNGMVAGFKDNEVWFCEPYHPHAWPPQYVVVTDTPIVGLGVTNGALVVCTASIPYVISGNLPSQMTPVRCDAANPCSSRGSVVSAPQAVSYSSPNGLIQVTSSALATNTTDMWMTRENWQQLTPQTDARAVFFASCYFCLGTVSVDGSDTSEAQRGFTIALDQDSSSFTIWPQPGGHRLGFELLDSPTGLDIQNVLTDPWTGVGMVISDGSVWYFDFEDTDPDLQDYDWKSKLHQQNAKRNYSAMKVFFTVPPSTATQNATRLEKAPDDAAWDTLPADRYGYLFTLADVDGTGEMTRVDAREIRKPGEVLRIVDGFKANHWQWQIVSRVRIANIQIATSVKELSTV